MGMSIPPPVAMTEGLKPLPICPPKGSSKPPTELDDVMFMPYVDPPYAGSVGGEKPFVFDPGGGCSSMEDAVASLTSASSTSFLSLSAFFLVSLAYLSVSFNCVWISINLSFFSFASSARRSASFCDI